MLSEEIKIEQTIQIANYRYYWQSFPDFMGWFEKQRLIFMTVEIKGLDVVSIRNNIFDKPIWQNN